MIERSTSQQHIAPLNQHAKSKTYSADEVHTAITKGKLLNYYQPKVDNSLRRVVGVETLVRWFHPRDGMVYPEQFIGVAEAHGLIDDLTRVVLANALAQARAWQQAGLKLHVSVNLSVNNLGSPDFADLVVESSVKAGVPPQLIELEVAESCLKADLNVPLDALVLLREKQFRVSINDFDIENSSLGKLSKLPFDGIKLEPSTVHGARNSENLREKIESTVGLAKQLGMNVVAVGVEDSADWGFIKKTGCNTFQGGYISHPMPGPNLPGWLRSWHSAE